MLCCRILFNFVLCGAVFVFGPFPRRFFFACRATSFDFNQVWATFECVHLLALVRGAQNQASKSCNVDCKLFSSIPDTRGSTDHRTSNATAITYLAARRKSRNPMVRMEQILGWAACSRAVRRRLTSARTGQEVWKDRIKACCIFWYILVPSQGSCPNQGLEGSSTPYLESRTCSAPFAAFARFRRVQGWTFRC